MKSEREQRDARRRMAIAVAWGMLKQKKSDVNLLYKAIKVMENHANDSAWLQEMLDAFERRRSAA
ncbi:MAG TPA: hypothetical protein VLB49_17490 [Gemmatimonadales bacterium]|nr:hypothetical protein [Gemmatimonadales bacterium]